MDEAEINAVLEKAAAEMEAEAYRLLYEHGWPNKRVAIRMNDDGTLEVVDLDQGEAPPHDRGGL